MRSAPGRREAHGKPAQSCVTAGVGGRNAAGATGRRSRRGDHHHGGKGLKKIRHFVVIYQENHSFDNLYGGWERVDGVSEADAAHTRQVDQAGAPYGCLMQNDVNLTSPPLAARCTGTDANGVAFTSHFLNAPFRIDDYIAPSDTTCPA